MSARSRNRRVGGALRAMLWLIIAFAGVCAPTVAFAQEMDFQSPASASDAAAPAAMRDLAARLIPVYQDSDPDRYLANLSALQMVAGNYSAAYASRQQLQGRRRKAERNRPIGRGFIFDVYARAKMLESEDRVPFADGFATSFREAVGRLSDIDAYAVGGWLETPALSFASALQQSLDRQRVKDSIGQSEAISLIWAYLSFEAYTGFAPFAATLHAEDDDRRYIADNDLKIKSRDGSDISAIVVRPRGTAKGHPKPLPALLEFTLYDLRNNAKECAAHGYVGVVGYVRGSQSNPRTDVPYEHDGADARAVINWIAKQSWSDGQVAMYGEGYSGFTPWAAAAHMPRALKAIASSAARAPGIDMPMVGGVFQNSAYRWSLKGADQDEAVWRSLDQQWYSSGRPYRDMGRIHGVPNPIFIRWLNHPSYDRYWQKMSPYREQFARINIPVLTTTGYYAASEPGALYYFTQHLKYNPNADHTLLIGPYDDDGMQTAPSAVLRNYGIDAAALIDLRELRYQWFDHIFKGAELPALLSNRINYEVMGANRWQHAPSIDAMTGGARRFFLESAMPGKENGLTSNKGKTEKFVKQTVNFADRTDGGWVPPTDIVSQLVVPHHGIIFSSEPLTEPAELSGLFAGQLDLVVNKMDVDLNITLYEHLAGGDYIRLYEPSLELRASYTRDRSHRHLLKAGERQQIDFQSERMTSRIIGAGSRVMVVLSVNKRPDRELNYGTGRDVSEESVADAKIPLKIRWYNDSYIDLPLGAARSYK